MAAVMGRREELFRVVGDAATGEAARDAVMAHFKFSSAQAIAALDLQVRRFADFERRRVLDEAERMNDLDRHPVMADLEILP